MADLDPARVEAAGQHVRILGRGNAKIAADILAADDARAREQGLVATGDGLTVGALDALYACTAVLSPHERRSVRAMLPADLRARLEAGA